MDNKFDIFDRNFFLVGMTRANTPEEALAQAKDIGIISPMVEPHVPGKRHFIPFGRETQQ